MTMGRHVEASLLILLLPTYLFSAASSRRSDGNDLEEDLEQLSKNLKPIHLAPINHGPDEADLTESQAFEGDLMGIDKAAFVVEGPGAQSNAATKVEEKWPGGVVPYQFSKSYTKKDIKLIIEAMRNIQDNTCIRFRRSIAKDEDYVLLLPGRSTCSSYPGRKGSQQAVHLSKGCMSQGTILHEILHALGFYHEHTRGDRDDHVEINYANIAPENEVNFQKYNGTTFDIPYDYDSVLHYKWNEFAIDPKEWTIRPLGARGDLPIGQRDALSKLDVRRINLLYECEQASEDVCGYMWARPNFEGLMTVIYKGVFQYYYSVNSLHYASAEILAGFEVSYQTEGASDEVTLVAGKYRRFQPEDQLRAMRRGCERAEVDELNIAS